MRIQSRILLSIAASLAVSGVLAFFAFSVVRGIGDDIARDRYYDEVIKKTFALNLLVATFNLDSGQRNVQQLGEVRASLTKLLDGLSSSDAQEESLIRHIQRNNRELGPLLDQFFAGRTEQNPLEAERTRMLAAQLWTKARQISDDTYRLMEISESRIVSANAKAGITVLFLLITLIATNVVISLISGRSIVRMQEGLQKQREWLQVTLTSIGDAVIATDTESKIVFFNPVAAALTGWAIEESLGRPVQDVFRIINEKTRAPAEDIVGRVLREGGSVTLANHTALIARDGREIPIEDSAAPIKDTTGKVAGVVLVFHDVAEKRRATEALGESEAKYRTLFENMAEEVHFWQLVRDETGRIKTWRLVDVNPPTLKSWGWTSVHEIRGKTTDEIFGPGATEHYLPVVQKIMTEGVPNSFEDYFPNLNKHFRFTSVPLGDYFITTGADITKIKKAEEELRTNNEELTRLNNAMVGRELRMIELKKEVNELCARAGERPRYRADLEER